MRLTLKIKLLPTDEQADLLLSTMKKANAVCNAISEIAGENKVFNQFKIHALCYHGFKSSFNLSAQMLVRCKSKVAGAYKLDRETKRSFRPLGAVTYDSCILSYKDMSVSIWAIGGRLKIPFVYHNPKYLPYIKISKVEADLVYKKGTFYLFQTIDILDEEMEDIEEFIGVDFGLTDIVVASNGGKQSADWINSYREQRQKVRKSIQSKGTKGKMHSYKRGYAKLLKRLKGKERTTATIINHTIAKNIVLAAKAEHKRIAIEDLTDIRFTSKRRNKTFATKLGRSSFGQLRSFLKYKSKLHGVNLIVVEPRYTSQTCSCCHHVGIRKNKSFKRPNCGNDMDADINAAINIATLRSAINQTEKSGMYCSLHTA
ncbi:RNA-guided endonuclease InsQ/TnpB family protein [Proteiniphilum acetatigenes]|uniref:RNA-guided endonuclease InsQ/TnpB family protein n=1 Tax=Proteiniphilum acetatigenes TaxID=294710 RepID=UPI00036A02A7|nr:RNA-guided endonuclease TnpB family protein [Proteiniphilum acetatigenes]